MDMVHTVLLALILVASVVAPMIVYLRLRAQQRAETERLIARMEEALGSSVKLLEVRTYYDQISAEYKKMLDEAFREGNRFRQDHVRRLIERLEQLKARTLDRTVRMLDQPEGEGPKRDFHRRHHRGGRRHRPPAGQPPNAPSGPPGYTPPKPPAPPQPPKPPAQG
ncbi:MAG: hypothetical protein ACLQVA_10100 [Candidatus Brocadiia bacterium]